VWEGRLRLWIAIDGRNAIGPGKVRLLEAIAATKSLSEAAKQLRMSYRLAWKHLRAIEEHTNLTVVHPRRGGCDGGGTDLTPEGKALLEAYRNCRREVEEQTRDACRRYFAPWSSIKADAAQGSGE
jgi:molybdate transport system regulatory protein